VIDNGGSNTFHQTSDFHSGVHWDFVDMPKGIKKKINVAD
jgi:hypothetical protein